MSCKHEAEEIKMFMIFLLLMATAALQVRNPPSKIQSQSKHSVDIPPKSVRKTTNVDGMLEKQSKEKR